MTPEAINAIAELGAERARAQQVAAKAIADANDLRRSLSDAQGEVRSLKADLTFVEAERDAARKERDEALAKIKDLNEARAWGDRYLRERDEARRERDAARAVIWKAEAERDEALAKLAKLEADYAEVTP